MCALDMMIGCIESLQPSEVGLSTLAATLLALYHLLETLHSGAYVMHQAQGQVPL